ncbi:TetR/AcrR family transcriptional regulator [Luteipulveratus flavus]|uniref:TetR/AcrR family transcriptional regulator n=1 Tax=Luteipulveratus flavus TaxID=3031728 RepID=A0ABT6C6P3_9MICO|nr:TetR/AcrR family transcriptional regulator [Luteipulveratus sp. YIM 133296]MDF8264510.1 TetR/AcrR family transcriptional regulator [Luteipulveratus sp. YIM 133296]
MAQVARPGAGGRTPRDGDAVAGAGIIEAARNAFAQKGFHGTTTRDIAAAAGMSPAAVYVHHPSKESLLFQISRHGHQAILDAVRAAVVEHDTPTAQLRALVWTFAYRHAAHHTSARVVYYEAAALTAEHREVVDGLRDEIGEVMHDVLAAGQGSGEFRLDDIELIARSIAGMGVDVARWYEDGGPWTPEQIAEHQAEAALRMVVA